MTGSSSIYIAFDYLNLFNIAMEDEPWMIHDGLLYLVTMVISIVTLYYQRAYFSWSGWSQPTALDTRSWYWDVLGVMFADD